MLLEKEKKSYKYFENFAIIQLNVVVSYLWFNAFLLSLAHSYLFGVINFNVLPIIVSLHIYWYVSDKNLSTTDNILEVGGYAFVIIFMSWNFTFIGQ